MKHQRSAADVSSLTPIPLLQHEPVYVGIDVSKTSHVAGFVSATLLARHERFEARPTHLFANSREGFRSLGERLRSFAPLEHVTVLVEHTGHYHRSLVQFLQEMDVPIYVMPVQKRSQGLLSLHFNQQQVSGIWARCQHDDEEAKASGD